MNHPDIIIVAEWVIKRQLSVCLTNWFDQFQTSVTRFPCDVRSDLQPEDCPVAREHQISGERHLSFFCLPQTSVRLIQGVCLWCMYLVVLPKCHSVSSSFKTDVTMEGNLWSWPMMKISRKLNILIDEGVLVGWFFLGVCVGGGCGGRVCGEQNWIADVSYKVRVTLIWHAFLSFFAQRSTRPKGWALVSWPSCTPLSQKPLWHRRVYSWKRWSSAPMRRFSLRTRVWEVVRCDSACCTVRCWIVVWREMYTVVCC